MDIYKDKYLIKNKKKKHMLNQSIANNYSEVLFRIKNFDINEIYSDFLEYENIIKDEPLFSEMLRQDYISNEKKKELFYNKFTNLVKYKKFFDNIFDSKKSLYITSIIDNFIKIYRKKNKIGVVEVVSSFEMDTENLKIITDNVKKKFNFNDVIINNRIDSNIIAGFIVYVDNHILDFSIKSILHNFKHKLKF